ncbi:MAG: ribbon-helix-helix protein, CopG family [Cyanobacteria bacterium Co-bin8]|nr:ribbon-helix-helix protein, CopG family [Cyanobacteria bacterium Co-bin8]
MRCSDEEYAILQKFCEAKERSQNDVLRELIRSLEAPASLRGVCTSHD